MVTGQAAMLQASSFSKSRIASSPSDCRIVVCSPFSRMNLVMALTSSTFVPLYGTIVACLKSCRRLTHSQHRSSVLVIVTLEERVADLCDALFA
eukprot:6476349-Amphidinium_carterae.2